VQGAYDGSCLLLERRELVLERLLERRDMMLGRCLELSECPGPSGLTGGGLKLGVSACAPSEPISQ
jgi:hypothetical protein